MGNAADIIEAAIAAGDPTPLSEEHRFYAITIPNNGATKLIDLKAEADKLLDAPRRKTGVYKTHDAESFLAYLNKHGDPDSEVWADAPNTKITGVLNAHEDTDGTIPGARFEDHRVEYTVLYTPAWKRWTEFDGKLLEQQDFAELIEERAVDIHRPTGADMLEVAQTFKATVGVHVESSTRLSTGQRQFTYHEEIDGKAGRSGQLEIPETFDLALQPFEGADAFKVTARLRYRMNDGVLRMGYKLERPEDVVREAFLSVLQKVQQGLVELNLLNTPILLGSR